MPQVWVLHQPAIVVGLSQGQHFQAGPFNDRLEIRVHHDLNPMSARPRGGAQADHWQHIAVTAQRTEKQMHIDAPRSRCSTANPRMSDEKGQARAGVALWTEADDNGPRGCCTCVVTSSVKSG